MGRLARLARLLGALGGLGALAWAMRDRFISIAVPREPEPPAFRSQPRPPAGDEDLTRVKGIGPVFAERLKAAGITSFAQLAATSNETLASIADVPPARVETWRKQAQALGAG